MVNNDKSYIVYIWAKLQLFFYSSTMLRAKKNPIQPQLGAKQKNTGVKGHVLKIYVYLCRLLST